MSVRYKVHARLAQWVRRYATAPNTWAHMMFFWLFGRFGVDPQTVIATPFLFLLVASDLPAFYRALLRALTALHGSLPQAGLFVGSANTWLLRGDPLTCKSCYQLLLSLNPAQPHCVVKFRSNYGDVDCNSTWKSLFFLPLDKPIDLCWKVARGVSRLIVSVVTLMRLWSICSSIVPWPKLVWIGFSHYSFCSQLWHQLLPCVMFFSVSVVMSCCVFLVSSVIFCLYLSFFVWCQRNEYRFRSKPASAVGLIASIKGRLSLYLPLLFKRFRSPRRRRFFQRHWGANGRIGKFVGDYFHFCLS